MQGKLIIHAPDEPMGLMKYHAFIDDKEIAELKKGGIIEIPIEKDCIFYAVVFAIRNCFQFDE